MIIDSHQHFWKLDRGDYTWLTPDLTPLYRDFLPGDLKPSLDACGVSGTILVQAADSEAETEFLLDLADQHDWILGVVGWVDLEDSAAVSALDRLATRLKLVGIRPMIQDIKDDAWMLRPSLRPAIMAMIDHDLTFDALVLPRHLAHLRQFLAEYPDLRIVVDHCAKPQIRDLAFDGWADELAAVARDPRVFCKLSGLVTEAGENWTADDLRPYIAHVLTEFGARRLLFGSDWPVLTLASSYRAWLDCLQEVLDQHMPGSAGSDIFNANVYKAYPRMIAAPPLVEI